MLKNCKDGTFQDNYRKLIKIFSYQRSQMKR